MANNYTTTSLEALKYICSVINKTIDLPSTVISDTSIATNTTYSSFKLDKEFTTLDDELKHYTDAAIAGLNKLSKEIINDKALAVKDNVLYLYKADDDTSNNYMQMMLINGVVVELGTTKIDMTDYYTKTETDDSFLKKTDASNTYATIATVNGKVDKTNILSAISSNPSNEKVLSEKAIKSELDLKANDNEVLKTTDIKTTVDIKLTDKDICSGKAIYEAIEQKKDCIGKETVLYSSIISSEGTFTLTDNVNNYDFIIINHIHSADNRYRSVVLSKTEISKCTSGGNRFFCVNGLGSDDSFTSGYFNKNKVVIVVYNGEKITSITGYKFGEVTIQHVIDNPAPDQSYSTSEQLTGGTWIDGKPIYRRVYTGLSLGTTEKSWTSIGVSLPSNLDKVINARAANITASTYRNDNLISIALSSRTLMYYTTNSYSSNVPNTLILEYTKK